MLISNPPLPPTAFKHRPRAVENKCTGPLGCRAKKRNRYSESVLSEEISREPKKEKYAHKIIADDSGTRSCGGDSTAVALCEKKKTRWGGGGGRVDCGWAVGWGGGHA